MKKLNIEHSQSDVKYLNYKKKNAYFYIYVFDEEGIAYQNLKSKNFILDVVDLPKGITKDFIISVKKIRKNFINGIYQISLKPSDTFWNEGEYIFALKVESENKENAFKFLKFEIPYRSIQ